MKGIVGQHAKKWKKNGTVSSGCTRLSFAPKRKRAFSYKASRVVLFGAGCFFIIFFVLSSVMALRTHLIGRSEQAAFDRIAEAISVCHQEEYTPPSYATVETEEQDILNEQEGLIRQGLLEETWHTEYYTLYEQNPDFACWISIDNTEINYPVMFTPDHPEYYLNRAFDGSKARSGTPFIGEGGSIESDCFIIYAHNMKNGTMFGTLDRYGKAGFWDKTPKFTISTILEKREFEVFAVVKTRVLYNDESGFRYYYQVGDLDENSFSTLIDWFLENSLYNTGILPSYGDQIVLLSTCSYHSDNGRFVVAARHVRSAP